MLFAQSVWSTVGLTVLESLLPVLGTIITVALVGLIKKGIDKLGVNRSEQIDTMIDKYVGIGVDYAERAATKKLGGRELKSGDKLSLAVKTVMGELDQSGVKGVAEDLIVGRIEALLSSKDAAKNLAST